MGKGHGLVLYLPDELVLSLAKVQVEFCLGRSFAGLLMTTEGAHKLGVLSDEHYEKYKNRYSAKLLERPKKELKPVREVSPPTLKQIRKKTELEELEKTYSNVLEQWVSMKEESKKYYLKKVEKDLGNYPDLKNAKLILELGKQEDNHIEG